MASLLLALTMLAVTQGGAARGGTSIDDFQALSYDDGRGHRLPYRLFVPRPYDPKKSYPMVVLLHGAGGRGTDNRQQLADQAAPMVFVQPANQARWPAFVLAPQCPADQKWVEMPWGAPSGRGQQPPKPSWPMAAALDLVEKVRRDYPAIDPARLYVTGMSMGGYGTWDAIIREPNLWKAAVVICGGYDDLAVYPVLRARLPIWIFHAADDPVIPVERSRQMVGALRAGGGTPRYTEYPPSLHHGHAAWKPAYSDPALLPWMFGEPPVKPAAPPR